MAERNETLELRFRIFDGTDIGHGTYPSSVTTSALKQRLLSLWPQDKSVVPKSVSDMKLIHAGRFLENGKTLTESGVHAGDLPGGVITMHVVVQPSVAKQKKVRTRRRSKVRARVLAPSFRAKSTHDLLSYFILKNETVSRNGRFLS